METLIIMAAITLANWALHKWVLKPEQERAKAANIGDVSLPRATEDAPVPLIYGRCKITGGNVVWMGKLTTTPVKDGSGNIVGYNYFLPFQMVFGVPGGNAGAKLGYVWVDDRLAGYGFPWLVDRGQALFDTPTGGLHGEADWYGGDPASGYTSTGGVFEANVLPISGEDPTAFTTYKGYCLMTFFSSIADPVEKFGFALGTSVSPGAIAVEVVAPCEGLVDPSLGAIGDGDANPMNMLWDLLTNEFARLGLDPALLDPASFLAVGQTLEGEQHGISLAIYNANDAREIIREILVETATVIYQDPETQLIKVRAIRADYTVGSLPVFDPSNVIEISNYTMSTWAGTYNEVRVVYTDRDKGYTERTAFSTDLANYAAQDAKARTIERRYQGISNLTTAAFVAARELRALSRPLRRVRMRITRAAFTLRPGDVYILNWPDYQITNAVFRVLKFDLGDLTSNAITIDAAEDVFAIDAPHDHLPPTQGDPYPLPHPLAARRVDEAPRWLQQQAVNAARISNVDVQHAWHLAVAGTNDGSYQGRLSTDAATFVADNGLIAFPGTATVGLAYGRQFDPYDTAIHPDTTTGILLTGVTLVTPATLVAGAYTVADQISKQGANLVLVGSEIIAYETATDLGGGSWRLDRVWRGLLDTAVADHPVGERVYFLTDRDLLGLATELDVNQVGTAALPVGLGVYVRELPYNAGGLALAPESSLPYDALTIRGRTLLPYLVADLQLAASKTPAAMQEEGIDVAWRKRDRRMLTITRGDAVDETVEAGTTWDLRAAKLGLAPLAAVDLQTGLSGSSVTRATLAKAGHGTISVQVRSQNANGASWADAALPVTAYFWRNLLRDPRWAYNDASWTTITGTGSVAATGGLGNGPYITGFGGPVNTKFTIRQIVDVTGYKPTRLRQHFAYYAINTAGGDTSKATLAALDAGGGLLGSVTATVTPSTTVWTRYELTYADLPAGTVSVLVQLEASSSTPLSASPSTRYAETCLRLGQGTGTQLLANPEFETGLTSWTAIAGAMAVSTTAPLYLGAQYVAGTTVSATNTIRQEATLPAGYEFGTAVFECSRGQPTAAGTANPGEVKLMAVDAGGTILATATTGAETFTANTWTRRRLTLDIPATTTKLRVEFIETAGVAGSKRAALDDTSLFVWKHLDPDAEYSVRFDVPPAQLLPADKVAWEVAFPGGVRAPDLLAYDGTATRATIGTGDLTLGTNVRLSSQFVGIIDPVTGSTSTTCIDFSLAYRFAAGLEDAKITSNPTIGDFRSTDRWAVVVVFRAGETPSVGTFGLCGRLGVAAGWTLEIVNGVGVAELDGSAGTVSVAGTAIVTDGGIHYLGIAYDGTNLHLYDQDGDHTVAAAGAGEFYSGDLTYLRLGRRDATQTAFAGQIARFWAWKRPQVYALPAPTWAQIDAIWQHGLDPSGGAISTYSRGGGTLAVPVAPSATEGARIAYYQTGDIAIAYVPGLAADGGTGYGLATCAASTNLVTSQNQSSGAGWVSSGSLVLLDGFQGPDGFYTGALLSGPATEYRELQGIAIGAAATTAYVIFHVRSADGTAFTMRSRITDSTGATVDTFDVPVTADGKWIRVAHAFAWSGATATMRLRFYPTITTSHAIVIGGPYFVGKDGFMPLAYSPATAAASFRASVAPSPALPAQLNAEGEIVTVSCAPVALPTAGTIAALRNGANTNDKRRLYVGASSSTRLDHYDGAAASNTAATSGGGIVTDRTTVTTERGRWCQAEVFDAAAVFTDVQANALALANGRVATWTRGSATMAWLDVGHDNGSDLFTGVIRSVTVRARESKL